MNVRVGDYTKQIRVEPTLRPELTAVEVEVALPEYLGRTKAVKKDGRGGSVSVLKGSCDEGCRHGHARTGERQGRRQASRSTRSDRGRFHPCHCRRTPH